MKVGIISLGCSKNQVDSEMFLGLLKKEGFLLTTNQDEADLIIINTCAFIEKAKKEAIEQIFDCIANKHGNQKIVVTGCLSGRYKEELIKSIPEVDLFIPIKEYPKFSELISNLFKINKNSKLEFNNRVLISQSHSPVVRISDGCNNHCSFCAIPLIRGKYVSREIEDILTEVKYLISLGAKELNIVAQDTSKYGIDNYHKLMIVDLLKELVKFDEIFIIRLYYIYPETLTDELINFIKLNPKVAPYFDIPLQHGSNHMLKLMNRHTTKEKALELINKIKREIPHSVIRTTLMVGFPHESNKDFNELLDFVKQAKFFHMGAFIYSKEEGTPSYKMINLTPKFIINNRYNKLMSLQKEIALSLKKELIGNTYQAIVDSYDEETYTYSLRNYMFASDDVDSSIIATCPFENDIKIGDIVNVKILDASSYELYGEIIK